MMNNVTAEEPFLIIVVEGEKKMARGMTGRIFGKKVVPDLKTAVDKQLLATFYNRKDAVLYSREPQAAKEPPPSAESAS